jgi:hypothetical protein
MALSNAERQRRYREKRNEDAALLHGTPHEIAEGILRDVGPKKAHRVATALSKRVKALRPDCRHCAGTGFAAANFFTPCGQPMGHGKVPCDCGPIAEAMSVT